MIFGQGQPKQGQPKVEVQLGLSLTWMGHINDDFTLTLLYSAADVMIVPSRIEAFGQTASEAQACGCPVVAFNATGLTDIIEHKVTGYLAEPYSSEDLAKGISWILEEPKRLTTLGKEARKRATKLWSSETIVPQYIDIYSKTLENHYS